MKNYCVCYSVTTSFDAEVTAKSKEEAVKKVIEVIGDPVAIEGVWEVRSDSN